jgi:hypothetical protein
VVRAAADLDSDTVEEMGDGSGNEAGTAAGDDTDPVTGVGVDSAVVGADTCADITTAGAAIGGVGGGGGAASSKSRTIESIE